MASIFLRSPSSSGRPEGKNKSMREDEPTERSSSRRILEVASRRCSLLGTTEAGRSRFMPRLPFRRQSGVVVDRSDSRRGGSLLLSTAAESRWLPSRRSSSATLDESSSVLDTSASCRVSLDLPSLPTRRSSMNAAAEVESGRSMLETTEAKRSASIMPRMPCRRGSAVEGPPNIDELMGAKKQRRATPRRGSVGAHRKRRSWFMPLRPFRRLSAFGNTPPPLPAELSLPERRHSILTCKVLSNKHCQDSKKGSCRF